MYAYAPDPDEDDHGVVKVATDAAVICDLTPAEARKLAAELTSCADYAEDV